MTSDKIRYIILFFFLLNINFITDVVAATAPETTTSAPAILKIAVKQFPPFVFKDEFKGFCIDMAEVISKKYNYTPEFVRYHSVTDVLNAVKNGEVHMGFSGITITKERERSVDFSQPFFDSGLSIAVRQSPGEQKAHFYKAVIKVVGFSILAFLLGLTLIAHIVWFIEKDDNDTRSFSTSYHKGIIDAYWWAVVTMTTVGYGDKCPKKNMGRIAAAVWMLVGIMWFAGFTATLSSVLTLDKIRHGEIEGLADLTNKRVAVIQGTTSEDFLKYYNIRLFGVESLDDLIDILKGDRVDAVVYDAPALMYIGKLDPEIKVVGEMFDKQRYGIVFPEGNNAEYIEHFNFEIIDMEKNGDYRKIYDKWF